ncbi:DNA gyrase subunit A [Candidatus Desantisbacteria bacterium CG_4_9_14_3_um_filter_40_11]|uniref:DNA gyrase subunit A n=3 Tax=unclassified Candidatus Desantisiibacteriota TaxID=3106372 RepID=A0A2M7JC27_9BACT|nr:MAG: DNA gyrase subunit A [Candidatus Desantisbacteria bacterium CG_4_8_14_3_um_filter_40_12]PJB30000.1 MAG: DNA gyrase subunit A [Candidatus Desantisbacteria bacterium CG_4_9_14_3_um_filter_40_11]
MSIILDQSKQQRVIPRHIEDEMKDSYIDYAMSVIVGRALPDVRDGLKPVHRRILYAMNDLSLTYDKPYKKSARLVGEVLGKYHPHGDTAVYDTMVRMAQDFSYRYPFVDGQGNFGSIDGDNPAAMRYTETRLSKIAGEMLKDIDSQTVDFISNFDESLEEPSILPARLPNLLLNGTTGIAVGMATNIPPHNLGEIVDATIKLINNPQATIEELLEIIQGPDFPTGGIIFGKESLKQIYLTGRGAILTRARTTIETTKQGRESIIVTEIPYQVNKAEMIKKIAELVKLKKLENISEIRDESDREGLRIVVEIKRDGDARVVLNQLYKHTRLQTSFGVIMLALVDNQPQILNVKQIMQYYIGHRRNIIVRRTKYELKKAEERAHILEGFKIALDNLDAVIATIRAAKSPAEAKKALVANFGLSEIQAQAILEMQLQRITALERNKIEEEYLNFIRLIEQLRSILASEKKVDEIIEKDLLEIKKLYDNGRRTQIITEMPQEINIEDLITEEEMVIAISHTRYIKRIPLSAYRAQHRGGTGVTGMGTRDEDFVEHVYVASTHEYILFFTTKGKVYWLKVHEIPEAGRIARGKALVNFFQLEPGEEITASVQVREFTPDSYLLMATKKGIIKKTQLMEYSRPRVGGIIAINLNEGDELIRVELTNGSSDVILSTKLGKAIRFHETDVRSVARGSIGVIGIRFADKGKEGEEDEEGKEKKEDEVVGMVVAKEGLTLLTVTANGYGKRTNITEYRNQARGGSGVIDIKTTEKNGEVVAIREVSDDSEVIIMTESGKMIRCRAKDISVIGRNTQGVRLIKLKNKDRVTAIAEVGGTEEL